VSRNFDILDKDQRGDLSKKPMPKKVNPMLATLQDARFSSEEWISRENWTANAAWRFTTVVLSY
jgi:hypothetical protein